ncbi:MAG: tRNA (adenosine(37)-N6)-threonylcarbamoyltransferase complex dimerization subunit type 1 TsaB [Cyclobacteriaceae bacterium]|nr:tRNA (adenosine(37)-N6)-threonylcarbamoyltransferase complex dimerization subunit type 1 TsaB [Cyclobacteriaceae bacterium]UYN87302.1 MAG: tRNA (adenosine(37)-N6)-threonylcarbamoyltransferase complex dimerization subunit type 1 TsaB [Cyclobacteriaceae bacterium]
MPLILSVETSTRICSVAIHRKEQLLTSAEIHIDQAHGAKLALLINDIAKFAGIALKDLNAVAISSGPGSYTGLRIGTSTAKGLCFALGIPLISVDTLKLMVFQMSMRANVDQGALLCPMIDARRMEVYCLVTDHNLSEIQPMAPKVIDESSFTDLLVHKKIIFFGDGAAKCKSILAGKNAVFIDNLYPQASAVGVMAYQKFKQTLFESIVDFEPTYLKDFQVKPPQAVKG